MRASLVLIPAVAILSGLAFPGGAATAAEPPRAECGVVAEPFGETDALYLSVVVTGTSCDDGRAVAQQWAARRVADEVPSGVLGGGQAQYGRPLLLGAYSCRWKRFGSDIGLARCDGPNGSQVAWNQHRGTPDYPERASYPEPEMLEDFPRPTLRIVSWSQRGSRPGPRYTVSERFRVRVCAPRGAVGFTVQETKGWAGQVWQDRYSSYSRRQSSHCQTHTIKWRLRDEFFGIGRYTVRISALSDLAGNSGVVKRSAVTRD